MSLLISGICMGVFFASGKQAWGRANHATTALFALLMIAVYERFASGSLWLVGIPALLGIAGLLEVTVTSGMTAAAKLDWLVSAKLWAIGFVGFLAWIGSASLLILTRGEFPGLAWLRLAKVAISAITGWATATFIRAHGSLTGEAEPPALLWSGFRRHVRVRPGVDDLARVRPRSLSAGARSRDRA